MNVATPFADLFARLETAMRLRVLVEPHADAAASNEPRMVWSRSGGVEIQPIPYTVPGEHTIARLAHPWTVLICGPSDLEVVESLSDLTWYMDKLAGPKQGAVELETLQPNTRAPMGRGYGLKTGKVAPVGDDAAAESWACDVEVTLYTRVRRIRQTMQAVPILAIAPSEPSTLSAPSELQLLHG